MHHVRQRATTARPGGVRRARRLGAVVLAGALLAAGCGDDDTTAEPDTSSTAPGTSGGGGTTAAPTTGGDGEGCTADTPKGDLTMGTFTEATSLDPAVSRGTGVTGGTELAAIYDTLMRWNPEAEEWEPRIAEGIESNDDFTEWTLTLRDDVVFANGDPFTSEAVKASIERFQAPDSVSRWASLSRNIASMDTPDDHSVVFTLTDPWATFPFLMAHEVGMIVNPAVVEELGAEAFGRLPVGGGAGAFDPVSFAPGEGIVMQGRDDYWGGPVCIDELSFGYIAGAQATYDAFRNGEFDVAFLRDPKVIAQAKDDGVGFFETLQNGGAMVMMNLTADSGRPTTDLRVRRAIAHAIDPEVINTRVWEGTGITTTAVFGERSRLYTIDGPEYDLEEARGLVEEAKADGFDGRLQMLGTSDPTGAETAIAVQAMLEAAGFTVDLSNQYNTTQMIGEVINGNYDIVGWGVNIDDSAPWPKIDAQLGPESPGNYWGIDDPDFTEAIAATKTATVDDLRDAAQRFQEVWNELVPAVVYATAPETVVWADHVKGVVGTQAANVFFADAWVER